MPFTVPSTITALGAIVALGVGGTVVAASSAQAATLEPGIAVTHGQQQPSAVGLKRDIAQAKAKLVRNREEVARTKIEISALIANHGPAANQARLERHLTLVREQVAQDQATISLLTSLLRHKP
jgi:hypothetical protein